MGVLRTKRALAGLVSSLQPVNTVYSHNAVARDQSARVQLGQTVARLVQCESMNSLYPSHLFIWGGFLFKENLQYPQMATKLCAVNLFFSAATMNYKYWPITESFF